MFRLTNPKRRKPRAHVLKAEGYLCDIIKTTRRTPDGGWNGSEKQLKKKVAKSTKVSTAFLQSKLKSADENTQFQDNTAQQFLYQQQPEQSQHHDAKDNVVASADEKAVAKKFGCPRSQVSRAFKNLEIIMKLRESKGSESSRQ
ncbi:hypothetical protein Bbelb_050380 [Branchiostoma belcheri]|nr:hypothetical protein Bbelb_050380 [Branchiostoma belcheri]